MKPLRPGNQGLTLLEILVTTSIIGAVGLIIFAVLNIGMVLGAKNSAVNSAHQQARTAMLQMLQDIHSAVSQPFLIDANSNPASTSTAAGIAFQLWSGGPYQIVADSTTSQNTVTLYYAASGSVPNLAGKRLIIATHGIEDTIASNTTSNPKKVVVTLTNNLSSPINGTGSYNITGFLTDRCSYCVVNGSLQFSGPTTSKTYAVLGNNITNTAPFSIPAAASGSSLTGVVSAINLSTNDPKTSTRGFKSANILLNQQIPTRARLTTYE